MQEAECRMGQKRDRRSEVTMTGRGLFGEWGRRQVEMI